MKYNLITSIFLSCVFVAAVSVVLFFLTLIIDVFPTILVCYADLFQLNRLTIIEQRYTSSAFTPLIELLFYNLNEELMIVCYLTVKDKGI